MKVSQILSSPITITILRFIVGALFILASYPKIVNPMHFSAVIAEYRILPESFVPFVAIVLPWLEFLCGIMLVLNVYVQSNALIIMVVLLVFTAGVTNNILRGIIHDCGCFELLGEWFGLQDEISLSTIVRDLFFILLILPVLFYGTNVFFRRK